MSIAIVIMTPIILIAALAVRFAGRSHALNVVDYARVSDPEGLHIWAGNRLLVLAAVCAALAGFALVFPSLSWALLLASIIAIVVVAIWLATGAARFQQ